MLAAQVFDIAAQGFDAIARLLEQAQRHGATLTLHDAQLFVLMAQASSIVELPGENARAHGCRDEGDQRSREERSQTASSGMPADFRETLRVLALSGAFFRWGSPKERWRAALHRCFPSS